MLQHIKISQRLWLMAGLPTLVAIVLTWNGLMELKNSRDALEDVYKNSLIPIDQLQTIDDLNQKSLIELLLADRAIAEKNDARPHLSTIEKNRQEIGNTWSEYMKSSMDAEEKAMAADYLVKREAMWTVLLRTGELLAAGNLEQANRLFDHELAQAREAQESAIDKLAKDQIQSSKEAHEAAVESYHRSIEVSLTLLTVGIMGVLLTVVSSIRHINRNLSEAGKATTAIANGDLTYQVPTGGHDEIGQLLSQMTAMRDKLYSLITDVRSEVIHLNASSNEMRNAAGAAAHVADNQSEATSSMAAAVEELSVSVDQVEEHSSDVYRITQESAERATESSKVIESAASEMEKIADVVGKAANDIRHLEEISNEITAIVGVIREVSEQTNLLALNAAIEAARAGESGRGFAVVADEVRKLAERTNVSSGEIAQMVVKIQEASGAAVTAMEIGVKRVQTGVSLAHGASQSVEEIRAAQARITQAVEDIGLALKEQASATRDIAGRVEKVSQGTEELAATAHQNRGSAEELAHSAKHLEELAARFKVT